MSSAPVTLAPPETLLTECPPPYRKPIVTTGDLVAAKNTAEAALAACSAQVDSLRKWKTESLLPAS